MGFFVLQPDFQLGQYARVADSQIPFFIFSNLI